MRSLAAITMMVAVFAIPACAQRGAGQGGFSGHSGGGGIAGHAGFASHGAPVNHGSGPARPAPSRPLAPRNSGGFRHSAPVGNFRPHPPGSPIGRRRNPGGDHDRGGHRRAYRSPFGFRLAYPNYGYMPLLGGYDPNFWGSSNDSDSSNTQAASANADNGNQGGQEQGPDEGQYPGGYGPPDAYPPAPRGPYQPSATEPRPSATLEAEAAVTLVFKDGRPPEQVHNYVLTRTTLFVQDRDRRSIPVDQLDIAATEKTNLDAGVEFKVPTLPN
jgi:hypothetical protein